MKIQARRTTTIWNSATKLYCVLGNPVAHSKSPLVHNMAFQVYGINAVYLAFSPSDLSRTIPAIRVLPIAGASVTMPFKESVIPFLDSIDETARKIGAVNTIVNKDGTLYGYNTDAKAVADSLRPFDLQDRKVLILGAGGAAKAAAEALNLGSSHEKPGILIANRTREKGQALARSVGGVFVEQDQLANLKPDVIINTTSIGMSPDQSAIPFPEQGLFPGMVVMDAVYTPVNTCLIQAARKKGCHVVDGVSMFVAQAAAQFFLWTGIVPDTQMMRTAIVEENP